MDEQDEIAIRLGSPMAIRDAIRECQHQILIEEVKIAKLLEHAIGVDNYGRYNITLGIHDCEKSPLLMCCYERFDDPAFDYCIFCGDPHERK